MSSYGLHTFDPTYPITIEKLRAEFERLVGNRDSYGLKRSRFGTYVNPAIARNWKWFQLGAGSVAKVEGSTL